MVVSYLKRNMQCRPQHNYRNIHTLLRNISSEKFFVIVAHMQNRKLEEKLVLEEFILEELNYIHILDSQKCNDSFNLGNDLS